MVSRKRMAEGDELTLRWKWSAQDATLTLPKKVEPDMVGAGDIRIIDVLVDPQDPTTGTFHITTTKLTRPSKYDVYVTGELTINGQRQEIVSRPISVEVEEVKTANVAETNSGR
jgi:hypothetical protein